MQQGKALKPRRHLLKEQASIFSYSCLLLNNLNYYTPINLQNKVFFELFLYIYTLVYSETLDFKGFLRNKNFFKKITIMLYILVKKEYTDSEQTSM